MRRLLCAALLAGCANPNLYATARTLPRGAVQHTLAIEGVGAITSAGSAYLPTLPTYQLRVGVARRVDVGVRLANLTSLGVDGRVALLRGTVDVAIAPGLQGAWAPFSAGSPGLVYGQVPVLVGLHPHRRVTVVLSAGAGFGWVIGESDSLANTARAEAHRDATDAGWVMRAGIGAQLRVTPRFALHPEVTALVTPDTGRTVLFTGVGLQWGASE